MSKNRPCLLKHMGVNSPIRAYRAAMAADVDELVAAGKDADAAWLEVTDAKLADLTGEQDRIEQSVAAAYAKTPSGKKVAEVAKAAPVADKAAKPAPLYASRPVTNAADILAWAASQGFKTTLPANDLHVTVAYSRDAMDGKAVPAGAPGVSVLGGKRTVEPLGEEGAVVLKFTSAEMSNRWQAYRDAGASWDYEGYTPHVTITYDGKSLDLSKIEPYAGPIELGAETQDALNVDKADDYKEAEVKTGAGEKAAPDEDAPIRDVGEKIGGARKDMAVSTGPARKKASEDTRPAWARRFEVTQSVTGIDENGDNTGRWVIRDSKSLDWMKQPRQVGRETYATKAEAEAFVPIAAVSLKHRPVPTGGGKYEIWREITDRKRVKVVDQQFETREDALKHMLANAVQIIETNTTFGEADMPLPPDRKRIGPERRTGNVKGEDFKDAFGLRAVEFGNWNNQDERQSLMNDAWDGLMDLADVLGVPPKALGMNGDLALAFGARGHGLQSARAHYERDRAVINLTKENGAGSLAHELFHALDHYFGRQDGKASAKWEVQPDGTRSLKGADAEAAYVSGGFTRNKSGVRPELREAYERILSVMTKRAEIYVEDVAKVDKFTGAAREELAEALDKLRKDLSEQKDARYWKRNNAPASAEVLAEFDAIAAKMLAGELLTTDWRTFTSGTEKRAKMSVRWTNDALERISDIYKRVRGRSGFNAEKAGVADQLRSYMERYSQRLKMLADAQSSTEKTKMVPTDFAMNAKELDQGRGTEYWTTPHEMAARAFQGYVEDKIAEQGGVSRFLNYGPANAGILTPWGFKRPFPAGAERVAINEAFDGFVKQIQTRTDESGNVAMFSRTNGATGITVEEAKTVAATVRAMFPSAPPIIVHSQVSEAPASALRAIRAAGAENDVEAMFHEGEIHVFANHLKDVERALFVVGRHEIRHAGLAAMFGGRPEKRQALLGIALKNRDLMDQAKARVASGEQVDRITAIEEALADMPVEKLLALTGIDRLIAKVRQWLRDAAATLRKKGYATLADAVDPREWTDKDVAAFVLRAENVSRAGGGMQPASGGTMFARDTNASVSAFNNATGKFNPDLDPFWLKKGRESIGDSASELSEAEYNNAVAEYANQWRIESLLEEIGWRRRGSSNQSRSRYYVKSFDDADENTTTHEVRVSDHDDRHPNGNGDFERRFQINLAEQPSWDFDESIPPSLTSEEAKTRLRGLLPSDSVAPNSGGAMFSRRTPEQQARTAEKTAEAEKKSLTKTLTGGLNSAQDVRLHAGYVAGDWLGKSMGKLSWWHRTIGMPYNLALREPEFKPVYDAIQTFLNDVSHYAAQSANLAPTIVPKMDGIADVLPEFTNPLTGKKIGKSAVNPADAKAVAAPVFEGTLEWGRNEDGQPVRMTELEERAEAMSAEDKATLMLQRRTIDPRVLKMWRGLTPEQFEAVIAGRYRNEHLKSGVVWSDAELRSMFKLTDPQIGLYKEFRAATDKALDDLTISAMLRVAGKEASDLRGQALTMTDIGEVAELLRDRMFELAEQIPDDADRLNKAGNDLIDMADRVQDLKDRGYAPLSRFGDLTLYAVGPDGEQLHFELFETDRERRRQARALEQAYPDATITQGTVSKQEFELFAGVTPETLELFADKIGLSEEIKKSDLYQNWIRAAKSDRSGLKRMLKRKGVAGFSQDLGRVLASFVYSTARQTSTNLHAGTAEQAVRDISQGKGQLKDYAQTLNSYVKNPKEEAQALRSILFAQFLGGSIASAMVNATQPFLVTFPYLSQFGGVYKAEKQMARALADVGRNVFPKDKGLTKAMSDAIEDGIVAPQEVFFLQAQASGKAQLKTTDGTAMGWAGAKLSNTTSRLGLAWGKPFSYAELFNRRLTFIAAYRTAVEQGMPDPAKFARDTIAATQFTYNKGNRPQWARGWAGATLFTFKTYSISMVELMSRSLKTPEGRRAFLVMLAMLVLVAGLDGLPFMEDIEDVIDGAAQRVFDKNWSTKMERNRLIAEGLMNVLGDKAGMKVAEFVARGISAGMPLDVSGRLGLHNLIPGTGIFLKKDAYQRDVAELGGPAGSLGQRWFEAGGQLLSGDPLKAAITASPIAVQNVAKGVEMGRSGYYPDSKGNMVVKTTTGDAVTKAIGFQPSTVKRVQEITYERSRLASLAKTTEAEIVEAIAKGIVKNDEAAQKAGWDRLAQWNIRNPETPIRIKPEQTRKRAQTMTTEKTERVLKTMPRELRPGAAEAFRRDREAAE